jgi:hypothetical protein
MGKKKVWVIDLPAGPSGGKSETSASNATHEYVGGSGPERVAVHVGPVRDRSRLLVFLAYFLGPIAPLLMRQGRLSAVWAIVGWVGVPVWALMLWQWPEIARWVEGGRIPFHLWFLTVCGLALLSAATWARAVLLAGQDPHFFAERLSDWLQDPRIVGFIGLTVPGLGLLVTAAARRAALAVWNAGVVLLAAWVLTHGKWLWKCNRVLSDGIAPGTLETFFILAFFVLCIGGLIWIGGALDGSRRARERWAWEADLRGDWSVIVLFVVIVLFFATFRPHTVAQNLDEYAARMRAEDFHTIPLQATVAAMRLDPARPGFALHAAQLYEESGNKVEAELIRGELRRRWQEYASLLHPDLPDPQVPQPLPISADPSLGSGAAPKPEAGAPPVRPAAPSDSATSSAPAAGSAPPGSSAPAAGSSPSGSSAP